MKPRKDSGKGSRTIPSRCECGQPAARAGEVIQCRASNNNQCARCRRLEGENLAADQRGSARVGVADPRLDTYADVNRACARWLTGRGLYPSAFRRP